MLRARPDPKQRRPPVALCHGFALQKWSASRQNFQEGGPRTFPGIESLKLVNRFEKKIWYLQLLQYVRKTVTKQPGTEGVGRRQRVDRLRATTTAKVPIVLSILNRTSHNTSYPKILSIP